MIWLGANCVVVFVQTFLDVLLVVHVASIHLQYAVQLVGVIYRVAHPLDVSHVVAVAFFNTQIDVNGVVAIVNYAVLNDDCIAESEFVVFLNHPLLILCIALGNEFLCFEQTLETHLVCLLQKSA